MHTGMDPFIETGITMLLATLSVCTKNGAFSIHTSGDMTPFPLATGGKFAYMSIYVAVLRILDEKRLFLNHGQF